MFFFPIHSQAEGETVRAPLKAHWIHRSSRVRRQLSSTCSAFGRLFSRRSSARPDFSLSRDARRDEARLAPGRRSNGHHHSCLGSPPP
jgi:hypothetical protein